ncbi:MAG: hypothetical protein PHX25_00035 [Candidatus Pacebacteria bacterium]|nr:hypothetical protein [Candidatus Paceibacterota bacterium]
MKEIIKKIIFLATTLMVAFVGYFVKITKGLEMPLEENKALIIMTIGGALLSAIWLVEILLLIKERIFPPKMEEVKEKNSTFAS